VAESVGNGPLEDVAELVRNDSSDSGTELDCAEATDTVGERVCTDLADNADEISWAGPSSDVAILVDEIPLIRVDAPCEDCPDEEYGLICGDPVEVSAVLAGEVLNDGFNVIVTVDKYALDKGPIDRAVGAAVAVNDRSSLDGRSPVSGLGAGWLCGLLAGERVPDATYVNPGLMVLETVTVMTADALDRPESIGNVGPLDSTSRSSSGGAELVVRTDASWLTGSRCEEKSVYSLD
jgi:hypothetical protein